MGCWKDRGVSLMSGPVVLHMGLHKTGSISLQFFLGTNCQRLLSHGVAFYEGNFLRDNHTELHVYSIRPERDTPFKLDTGCTIDDGLRGHIEARVASFCAAHGGCTKIFSNQGVSFLRYPDEMQRLSRLFAGERLRLVVYCRNKAEFLDSYREDLKKHRMPAHIDRDLFAYTELDTWLIDYEDRIMRFREAFDVEVIDYDEEVDRYGSIIPSFLELLGVAGLFQRKDWENIHLNRRGAAGAR